MDRNEQVSRLKEVKSRAKRIRSYFSPTQTKKMEDVFVVDPFPDKDQIKQLSTSLDISERSLQVWFQNRRARQRKARPEANQELIGLRSSRSCYQYPSSSGHPFETMTPSMQVLQDIKRKGEESIKRISIDTHEFDAPSPHTSPTRSSRIELLETPPGWHRTQPSSPIKKPTKSTSQHSIEDSDFLSPSPKRQRSFSVRSSDENAPKPGVKCSNLTDDYKSMHYNYHHQMSDGYRNPFETPSPISKNRSHLSLSPDDDTILNLCTRDTVKGFKATSPIILSPEHTPPKPATLQPSEIYPHWNAHLAYGCTPGFPPMPPHAVTQYYATLYHYHMSMEAQYGEALKSQMTPFPGLYPPVPKLKNMYESIPEPDKKLANSEKLTDNVDKA
ncbi:hypothetical protein LOTGIDRAFT_235859 [Lottia gigantea]|uniref:Homeobox domain-containing protein n=1 Tax=Lottia gigantea TaxID=225164 RepID=V3Z3J0_LOTGI|nr:hypothetical protein LOTGIDRAFT_235859 [Lottia gigantea]ESO85198.1 hypothetical protein LOTGIDRAFT_235859 [Lottia gigantea]